MTRFAGNYEIGRHTGRCAATDRPLEVGQPCVTALCEREEDDGFARVDFSLEAWEAGERPPRVFSFWKTTVPEPNAKPKVFVDDETLLDLFNRLQGDERPQRLAFRFVLGLVLLRKRLLRQVGRERDGEQQRWLLKPKGASPDDPPIVMVDPEITDEDVAEIAEQLGEVLDADFLR